ncbi:MAG TPA: AAA family ATPase [Polyangiaceae bacterium]|nr:AAA family ATPase [Polyangiaceae bacterium]
MLNEPTMNKLLAMRLAVMASAWAEQQKDPKSTALDFDERFGLLVDAEYLARDNRKVTRLLKAAKLRLSGACMEDVKVSAKKGLDRATRNQLASCRWIGEHLNVLISGATGVGKSYLACALGQAACRRGLRVLYYRLPRLFEALALAKADGTYTKLLAKIAKADLLVLDDLGLGGLRDAQRHDLLEILDDRYDLRSTVVTSQLPLDKWHEWLGEPTVADAILDRLVHNAYKLTLRGPSGRKEKNERN